MCFWRDVGTPNKLVTAFPTLSSSVFVLELWIAELWNPMSCMQPKLMYATLAFDLFGSLVHQFMAH